MYGPDSVWDSPHEGSEESSVRFGWMTAGDCRGLRANLLRQREHRSSCPSKTHQNRNGSRFSVDGYRSLALPSAIKTMTATKNRRDGRTTIAQTQRRHRPDLELTALCHDSRLASLRFRPGHWRDWYHGLLSDLIPPTVAISSRPPSKGKSVVGRLLERDG